jgi:hypothetical protein
LNHIQAAVLHRNSKKMMARVVFSTSVAKLLRHSLSLYQMDENVDEV